MADERVTISETEWWIKVDKKTGQPVGEIQEFDVVQKSVERSGFMITYLTTIIQLIESLGNQKMKVVKYILQNMDKSSNLLIATVDEIAENAKVGEKTVRETLKILEKNDIITRRRGVIMLSPKLIHRGDARKERYLLTKFKAISEKRKPKTISELPEKVIPIGL